MGTRERKFIMEQQRLIISSSSRSASAQQHQGTPIPSEDLTVIENYSPEDQRADIQSGAGRLSSLSSPFSVGGLDNDIEQIDNQVRALRELSATSGDGERVHSAASSISEQITKLRRTCLINQRLGDINYLKEFQEEVFQILQSVRSRQPTPSEDPPVVPPVIHVPLIPVPMPRGQTPPHGAGDSSQPEGYLATPRVAQPGVGPPTANPQVVIPQAPPQWGRPMGPSTDFSTDAIPAQGPAQVRAESGMFNLIGDEESPPLTTEQLLNCILRRVTVLENSRGDQIDYDNMRMDVSRHTVKLSNYKVALRHNADQVRKLTDAFKSLSSKCDDLSAGQEVATEWLTQLDERYPQPSGSVTEQPVTGRLSSLLALLIHEQLPLCLLVLVASRILTIRDLLNLNLDLDLV